MKKALYSKTFGVALVLGAVSLSAGTALGYGYGYGYGSNNPTVPTVVTSTNFMFTSNLGYGMRSADVVQLQNRLKMAGYFTYPTSTGYFGPITRAAVKAYQTANGIPSTGFVGVLTRGALNK